MNMKFTWIRNDFDIEIDIIPLLYSHCQSAEVSHLRNIMKVWDVTQKPSPQTSVREDIDNCLDAVVKNVLSFWKRWMLGLTLAALGVGSIFIFTNRHEIFGTCPSGWRNERSRGLGCLHLHLETYPLGISNSQNIDIQKCWYFVMI